MDWIFPLFLLAMIALAIFGFLSVKKNRMLKEGLLAHLQAIDGFTPQKYVIKTGFKTTIPKGVAIDGGSKQMALIHGDSIRVLPFASLIEVEVIAEGKTVTKTSRSNQALGVAVGAVLGGGVGALIGGLSAKTETKQNVKNVFLKLLVDDLEMPELQIEFVEMDNTGATPVSVATKEAQEWHNLLRVVLFQNEKPSILSG